MIRDEAVARLAGICLDCGDAEKLAAFYHAVLGWSVVDRDGAGWIQLRAPDRSLRLNLQSEAWYRRPTWPEAPSGQDKMIHLEIEVEDLDAAIALITTHGGREAEHQPADRDRQRLRIMLDPAGHPFCLFVAGE